MGIETYERLYPGFPEFVHHIMDEIAKGATPEEAAEAVSHKVSAKAVSTTIEEIERTKATWDSIDHVPILPEGIEEV